MGDDRWQVLSDWLSEWLEADPQVRLRLRDEFAVSHPDLIGEADRMSSSAESLTGFLDTPALVLAARELAVDAPVLPEGATVGPYRVVRLLARGGMGDVYRATDSRLGRDVALKVLSPARTGDPRRVERFLMEARVTARLDHPNIVRVYDVGHVDDQAYLVAELLDGETLRARIVHGPIAPEEVRNIALGVARGLAAAHDAGLVHRDLKPENIFLTRNGETKLLDFGIAKLTQDENVPDGASTLTGVVLGTAGYLAPEQVRGEGVDARADLFAFGAVLFEMVTGSRAFVREQIVDTLHAILHDPPALELEHRPGVPMSLSIIVGRLLQKAPTARFQSAAEVISALERADVGRTRSWPGRQIAKIRTGWGRPIWKIAAAAVLLLLVSAGMSLWNVGVSATHSIGVLQFECPDNETEVDYICDGMTNGLFDRLARVPSLTVLLMRFKGQKDPQNAAQTLGVNAVVTGEVSRRGSQIVVSAQLIHGRTNKAVWRGRFDTQKADLRSVQDSLTLSIAEALGLSEAERAQLGGVGTSNPEAFDLYLRGRYLLQSDADDTDVDAQKLFTRATELDSNFLNAHLGIVTTYIRSMSNGYSPPHQAAAQARTALEKVTAIDPNNLSVQVSRAYLDLVETHNWSDAEKVYRAVMHEPSLLRATQFHPVALFFAAIGKPDEAVNLVRSALDIDSGNIESRMMFGTYLLQARRLDDALVAYKSISVDAPDDPRAWFGISNVYKLRNDFAQAAEARRTAYAVAGDGDAEAAFTGKTTEPEFAKAEITVAQAELRELEDPANTRYVHPFDIARLHIQIGNREKALTSLKRAFEEGGHAGLLLLNVDPTWNSVRTDSRFREIVRRLRIP